MNDHVDVLIQTLEKLSPMPPDDSPQLTVERLDSYGEVIAQIDETVHGSEAERDIWFIKPLIRSFGYGDAYESYWPVIHILEKYPSDILRPALREAVQTGEPGARMWCAYMLGRQRNPEDVPVLIAALQDPEYKVRYNALGALAMIGDLSAKPAMETLLNDSVEEVRKEAKECVDALVAQRWVIRQRRDSEY
jgi:hypothetical protein